MVLHVDSASFLCELLPTEASTQVKVTNDCVVPADYETPVT